MKSGSKGFTLVEAMVCAVLVAIGVSGALRGVGAMTRAQTQLQERDRMQRLAVSKYDELVATGLATAPSEGDFQDYDETRYRWQSDVQPTSTTNLESLRVTVTPVDPNDANQVSIDGLEFVPPTVTTAGGTQ